MRGRLWLIIGVVVGVAVALGRVPYLAGAGRSLADTTQRLVDSGAKHLVGDLKSHRAPQRIVLGLSGFIAILVPGVTALLLVIAARASLRIRSIIAALIVAVGIASYFYQPHGKATGVLALALAIAAVAVVATGPLVAAPLAGIAGLIGAEFLPGLLLTHRYITQASVQAMHVALFNSAGNPAYLRVIMLVVAAIPFAVAGDLILRH